MIGRLRARVTLQSPVLTPDGSGGFTRAWEDLAEVFAEITTLSSGEGLRFHQKAVSATHRLALRFRADVTEEMRILRGNAVYDIVSVIDRGGRGEFLDILAEERKP